MFRELGEWAWDDVKDKALEARLVKEANQRGGGWHGLWRNLEW